MSGTDGAASAANAARLILEDDLSALPAIASRVPASALPAIERYVALLLEANTRLNLTRIVAPTDVARQHLLDALAALPLLDQIGGVRAVDLGSGGGVPAIPLAIARPDVQWLLVESVGRKAAALAGFVDALGLANVSIAALRAEQLGQDPAHRERADLVTARACAPLPVLAELALPLLRIGGELLAWKGPLGDPDDEVRRGRTATREAGGSDLRIVPAGVDLLGGHTFVRITKRRPTPAKFPRRPGEPGRRPLG